MNLIESPWIPVRRQSGEDRIAPWQITDQLDPVLALAAPRPDFNGALLQFLIGLLQTACPPEPGEQWGAWLEQPPQPEILKQKFQAFSYAFDLDGEGHLFMQDFDRLEKEGKPKPISSLLIDAPGAQALKQNTDHFIKRGGIGGLCTSCAATALFTLQTNAPSGGVGHRTSLRGGGPLSTLVALDPRGSALEDTLWRACWLNILEKDVLSTLSGDIHQSDPEFIFPWLAPTRTSEPKTGLETTPLDAHPLQMYWGMPRRIRLGWDDTCEGPCDLCNSQDSQLVSGYITQNYGVNYNGAWKHPLSPHLYNKDKQALPQHAQPGGINYRHWLGFVSETESSEPAQVVRAFLYGSRKLPEEQCLLRVFGYDMDNMKARCWYETTFPLYPLDEAIREAFTLRAQKLLQSAVETAGVVRGCIKEAWFKRPGDARGDTAFLVEAFLNHTETDFYAGLKQLKQQLEAGEDGMSVLQEWHGVLKRAGLYLFDYWTSRGDFEVVNPRRIAQAHRKLNGWFYGNKLTGVLGLPSSKEKVT